MTVQYIQIDKKNIAIVDLKSNQTLIEYLEDLEDSLAALERAQQKTVSFESIKQKHLTNHIQSTRMKLGLTQKQLAKKLKTTQAFVSKLENPQYRPKYSTLLKVAKALHVDVETLV